MAMFTLLSMHFGVSSTLEFLNCRGAFPDFPDWVWTFIENRIYNGSRRLLKQIGELLEIVDKSDTDVKAQVEREQEWLRE
jgi:hypothetical protein